MNINVKSLRTNGFSIINLFIFYVTIEGEVKEQISTLMKDRLNSKL